MSYQEASRREANAKRQHSKFTPERIRQIKDLVARGEPRERIAAIIGVTTASDLLEAGHQLTTTES